jgi:hypothetical protein
MKKIISLLLCAVLLCGSVTCIACSNNGTSGAETTGEPKAETTAAPTEIMAAIVAKYPDIPSAKSLYISGVGEDDEGYLDPEFASYLYTGNYAESPEMAMLESYAIRLPDGKSAFEIHILKVADAANIPAIEALLNSRIAMINAGDIKLYDPEGFDKVMKNAEVYTSGKYVYLLITTDNAPAKEAIATF